MYSRSIAQMIAEDLSPEERASASGSPLRNGDTKWGSAYFGGECQSRRCMVKEESRARNQLGLLLLNFQVMEFRSVLP